MTDAAPAMHDRGRRTDSAMELRHKRPKRPKPSNAHLRSLISLTSRPEGTEKEHTVSDLEPDRQAQRSVPTDPKEPASSPRVADTRTARADLAGGEDERRLIAAGWSPKERMDLVICADPAPASTVRRR